MSNQVFTKRRVLAPALVCLLMSVWAHEAYAVRLVKMDISLAGKVILEGSTGDNGHIDADGVWEYLKKIKFKPTADFQSLNIDSDVEEYQLNSSAPRGVPGDLVLNVSYGGRAITRKLTLKRVPVDRFGRQWMLDPAEVDALFDRRYIRRSDAAKLDDPDKTKR